MPLRRYRLIQLLILVCALACSLALPSRANATSSGTITYSASAGTSAASWSIAFTKTGTVASWRIERADATSTNGTCGVYGAWAAVSPVSPTSPWLDTTLPDGTCSKYRVAVTDTSTALTYGTGTNIVHFDRTAPATTITATPVDPWTGASKTINGTRPDSTGVSISLSYTGPASGVACTATASSAATWSCGWTLTGLPEGAYVLHSIGTDAAGNVGPDSTRTVIVDNTAPVLTLASVTELTGSQFQHTSGTTIYFNSGYPGSFTVNLTATDGGTGVNYVAFPSFGSGWTPGTATNDTAAPYAQTYAWSSGASGVGPKTATAVDMLAKTSTLGLTLTADITSPVVGVATANASGNAATITYAGPTSDSGSGLGTMLLQRASASSVSGTCGTYSGFADIAGATLPYVDTAVVADTCYKYRVAQYDNVGNVAYATTAAVQGFSASDTTAPTGTIAATPVSPLHGAVMLSGTTADSQSGVASATVSFAGATSGTLYTAVGVMAASWNYMWDTTTVSDGSYVISSVIVDNAGNSSTATRTVFVDNTAPLVSFGAFNANAGPSWQFAVGNTLFVNTANAGSVTLTASASDASGIQAVTFPPLGSNFTPATTTTVGTAPYTVIYSWTPGAAAPGAKNITANDAAGNTTTAAFTVTADTTAPNGGAITASWDSVAGQVTVSTSTGGDGGSGLAARQIQRRSAPRAGAACGLFGGWSDVLGANPAAVAFDATAAAGTCYEYRLAQTDRVGNTSVITAALPVITPAVGAGIAINTHLLHVIETTSTTDTFTIMLGSAPSAPVTVNVATDNQVSASPSALTFTSANWNIAQTVTVAAIDDAVDELTPHTSSLTFTSTSTDPDYISLTATPVTVEIVDNDMADVTVAASAPLLLAEGGANASFTVSLASQPTAPVTVTAQSNAQVVASSALTFTPANWNVTQTFTIDAIDDWVAETTPHAAMVQLTTASTDPLYDARVVAGVATAIADNDAVGIDIAPSALSLAEGGTGTTAAVVLAAQPTSAVTVAMLVSDGQLAATPSLMTFTPLNWNVPQSLTIAAVDDTVGEANPHSGTVSFSVTSADPTWNAVVVSDMTFAIADNDAPPADITPPTGASMSLTDTWANTPVFTLGYVVGYDAGTGIGTWRLQRRLATLGSAGCRPFGAWSNLGSAHPTNPAKDTPPSGSCAQYRLVVTDVAGNVAITPASGTLYVDRNTPYGSLEAASTPAGTGFTLSGYVNDLTSDVLVTLHFDGPSNGDVCVGVSATSGRFSCVWDTSALPAGAYVVTARFVDRGGNVGYASIPAAVSRTVSTGTSATGSRTPRDVEAPVLKQVAIPKISWGAKAIVTWKATDNSANPISYRIEKRTAPARGSWGSWLPVSGDGPSPRVIPLAKHGATTCFRVVATDAAGNATTSSPSCTTLPLDDRELVRSSGWKSSKARGSLGTTVSGSTRDNASLSTVVGVNSGVSLIAPTGPRGGIVEVVSGTGNRVIATISLRSKRAVARRIIPIKRTIAPGRLRIVVVGGTGQVRIDGLVVRR
ncbi:MAG: peptidase and in kexin sedolisin [Thermoleophilia bacterium]|nr:peptidase and in kexin sedolisin [Thermoleophilia bacterium]